jgi:dynein heavy chain 2
VLKGTALLTPDTLAAAQALMRRETPGAWLKQWDGPADAGAWLRAVVAKTAVLGDWLAKARGGTLLSQPLDLALLFRPEVFLNALRQQTAAAARTPVDALALACEWRADGSAVNIPAAAATCRLANLRLQGAHFDGGRLAFAASDAAGVNGVPACTVAWVPATAGSAAAAAATVLLPVYDTEAREKVVARLPLPRPAAGGDEPWILAGAALFLGATA